MTWDNQADCTNDENAVVVADTSGSMYFSATPKPISVAFSLATYLRKETAVILKITLLLFRAIRNLLRLKVRIFMKK